MDFSKWTPEYFLTNQEECLNRLQNDTNWCDIVFLNHANLCDLRDNSLVRFRGVVQDMYNPEIYLDEYEVFSKNTGDVIRIQNGKYRDIPFLTVGIHFSWVMVKYFNLWFCYSPVRRCTTILIAIS